MHVRRFKFARLALVSATTMLPACAGTDALEWNGAGGAAGGSNFGGGGGQAELGGAQSVPGGGVAGAATTGFGGAGAAGQGGLGAAGKTGQGGLGGAASGSAGRGGAGRGPGRNSGGRAGATSGGGAGTSPASAGTASTDLPPVTGATFTDVYTSVISEYCFGSGCHNPSGGNRPDFSTQAKTYTYFKNQGQLYPGQDPQKSYIYSVMHGNPSSSPPTPPYMPPTPNPKVAPDALAIVAGWIADGATND